VPSAMKVAPMIVPNTKGNATHIAIDVPPIVIS